MNRIEAKHIGYPSSQNTYFKMKAKCKTHKRRVILNVQTGATFCPFVDPEGKDCDSIMIGGKVL
jgi:hypothetical protein